MGGKRTSERVIVAVVSRKERAFGRDQIPSIVEGFSVQGESIGPVLTDVVETTGDVYAFGLRSGYLIVSPDDEFGSVFLTSGVSSGKHYLITNSHVVSDVDQSMPIGVVSAIDSATGQQVPIGRPVFATPLRTGVINSMDAALVLVAPGVNFEPLGVLGESVPISAYANFLTDDPSIYLCRSGDELIELVLPRPILTPAEVTVDDIPILFQGCWRLGVQSGNVAPGISGSLIYRRGAGGLRAVGIVFAGIPGKEVWAFPARSVVASVRSFMI